MWPVIVFYSNKGHAFYYIVYTMGKRMAENDREYQYFFEF